MGNESISRMIIVLCIMMSAYFSATETAFNFFFIQWKKLLSMVFKASEDKGITEEELLTIVEEARQDGGIDEQESSLIRSAIEFTELEAGDIFTPRIDVEAVSVDADQEEIARNKKIGALLKELQQNKMHITVEQMDEKRVKQVRIMVR